MLLLCLYHAVKPHDLIELLLNILLNNNCVLLVEQDERTTGVWLNRKVEQMKCSLFCICSLITGHASCNVISVFLCIFCSISVLQLDVQKLYCLFRAHEFFGEYPGLLGRKAAVMADAQALANGLILCNEWKCWRCVLYKGLMECDYPPVSHRLRKRPVATG